MRKILSTFILLSVCLTASAQGSRQLDSLAYILPGFAQGTVLFSDGQLSYGLVNISPVDQAVYCITEAKDTVTVMNYTNIMSVSAGGRSFFRWKASFVENLVTDGDTGVGVVRSTIKVNNVKTGAFGTTTATASIDSYSYDGPSGTLRINIIDDPRNFKYKMIPALLKDGKYYSVSKKSFEKLFPAHKDYIESVWDGHKSAVSDIKEAIDFYNELTHRQ